MTKEQWQKIKPGDFVIEAKSGARRLVLSVFRRDRVIWIELTKLLPGISSFKTMSYTRAEDTRGLRWIFMAAEDTRSPCNPPGKGVL